MLSHQDNLNPLVKSGPLYLVAHACWLSGRLPDAHRVFEQVRSMDIPPASLMTQVMMEMFGGILDLAAGNYPAASRTLQKAVALESQMHLFNLFGSARILLAHLYLKMDLLDDALAEISTALAEVEKQGAPGRILMEGPAAIPVLQLAVAHKRHMALAGRLLELLEADTHLEPRPVVIPDTGEMLSVREIEVLNLIAAGASNQEIANTLILSIHTVKRHVANSLAKLNVTSRTQAVARARELGVVE